MPCMDGFEVCRELRSRNRTRLIPIIFLTARESVEDKVTGFELGADDYITKPFNNRELLARIKSRIRRSEDELSSSPVTGLPGGNVVEQESNRWLQAGKPFYAIFILLDGFEHYRRAYGLNQGRHLLQYLARLISTVLEEEEEEGEREPRFPGPLHGGRVRHLHHPPGPPPSAAGASPPSSSWGR